MKACPFCAEDVQDAAVLCKHCGRDLKAPVSATSKPRSAWSRLTLYVLIALLLVGGVVGIRAMSVVSRSGGDALPTSLRQTILVNLASGDTQEIGAGQLYHYTFELPDRVCMMTGRILGVSGGNKDFYAALMADDDYRNWITSHEGKVFWQTDAQTAAATINAAIAGPGTFHLVVSNHFSTFTAKVVEISAQGACP